MNSRMSRDKHTIASETTSISEGAELGPSSCKVKDRRGDSDHADMFDESTSTSGDGDAGENNGAGRRGLGKSVEEERGTY